MIVLGNGGVGKSQLCRRLQGQPFDESVPTVHGVQIWREERVSWWDFGAQDIDHGTYKIFLPRRAVILILWTPQLENRDEHTENGITRHNRLLADWFLAATGNDSR